MDHDLSSLVVDLHNGSNFLHNSNRVLGSGDQSVDGDLVQILQPAVLLKTDASESSIIVEDGDLIQCGKCLNQYSFVEFVLHKKNSCGDIALSLGEEVSEAPPPTDSEEAQGEAAPSDPSKSPPLIMGLDGEVFALKVSAETNPNAILVESFQEFGELGGPTIRIIENDDSLEVTSPIIGNNYLLSNSAKEGGQEILLSEDVVSNPPPPPGSENTGGGESCSSSTSSKADGDGETSENLPTETTQQVLTRTEAAHLKCPYCQKQFKKRFDCQQHIRCHTGERPFQCVVCGRAFAQKSNVMKHMASHKVWPKKPDTLPHVPVNIAGKDKRLLVEKMFMCQYCPSIFSSYLDLKAHRIIHVGLKVFKCVQKECPLTFKELDEFLQHTATHEMASYECHICHLEFSSLDDLGQHQIFHERTTTPPKQLSCPKCRAKFMSSESLEKHLTTDSHNYSCPDCEKVFSSERFLRKHIGTHSPLLCFTCHICHKSFRTEHYLNMHVIIHSEEKPFECQICPAKFNRRDKLSRHNLTHENAKRYKCPFTVQCNKEFNRKDKLKQHILTHNSWKKHPCRHCSRSFSSADLRSNHEFLCGPSHPATAVPARRSSPGKRVPATTRVQSTSSRNESPFLELPVDLTAPPKRS